LFFKQLRSVPGIERGIPPALKNIAAHPTLPSAKLRRFHRSPKSSDFGWMRRNNLKTFCSRKSAEHGFQE